MTVPIDRSIVARFKSLAEGPLDPTLYACVQPPWTSDVQWISPRTEEGFEFFQAAFDQLQIAKWVEPYVDFEQAVRLYGGFMVARTACSEPSFHVDWANANNAGFTLLTPITDNSDGFGLLYKNLRGEVIAYEYKLGEALLLGSNFVHSTAPGRSEKPVVLLSFTFGTDKMEHWDNLAITAANQSALYRRPDGTFGRNARFA